jgi:hypothetical protein
MFEYVFRDRSRQSASAADGIIPLAGSGGTAFATHEKLQS